MFKNYFKTAWRSILKNKTTSVINITGLSVCISAAALILLWVQNEVNFDNEHAKEGSIYRMTTTLKEHNWVWETTPLLLADAAKKQVPEIENATRLYTSNWPVFNINGQATYNKKAAYVDEEWFTIFHYDFVEGNASSFTQGPYNIILTTTAATKYFGKRSAVGQSIYIDSMNYRVAAIIKDAGANSSFQYDAYLPIAAMLTDKYRKENDENWSNFNYLTFIKIKPGSNTAATEKKLTDILPGTTDGTEISLISLKDMHFESDLQSSSFVKGNRNTVYIFYILAFLLLLIACINYVNLTTAKASLRAKEVSVRKMIGARRIDLFYQFVAESLLISFIALIATLLLLQLALPYFNLVTGKQFVLTLITPNMWQVVGLTLGVALLLNSIYPALLLSSFKPLNVFRGFTVLKVKDSFFRKSLVVVQFTISIMLIACTIVIYRQMKFVQQTNPGYNRSQVVSFPFAPSINPEKKILLQQAIRQELLTQSSIVSVTMANQPIINIGSISTGSADWNGHDTTFNPKITQLSTDAEFAKTMQLEMVGGRWFLPGNEADKSNVVLNEAAVAQLNIPKPVLGQRFTFKERTGQVIGIVKDFKYKSMHEKTGPLIAFNDPSWFTFFMVRIAPHNASQGLSAIQNTWKKMMPGSPLEYNFLNDSFNDLYKEDQQASFLIFVFSLIAVVISSLGLFGLAAFTAEQRTKEIGIRKVLGATVSNITTLLSKDFVKLVGIAIVAATPIALFTTNKWMQNFAYRIDISWWMFAAAGIIALFVALATTTFQAIKAAIANPVKSLRAE